MYTLEECAAYWKETGKHGTKEERIARGRSWHPYYGYIAQKQLGKPWTPDPNTAEMIGYLRSEGVITRQDHVLDIGAGMGGYAMEMAQHCRKVTAIDNSPECIAVIRDKAARSEITNISAQLVSWEEFAPVEKYDVTFSSMCPAICNLEELRRMEAMTNRSCCLIAVTRGSYDKHRMRMMKELQLKPKGGMTTEALHYINVLYLLGRQPNVRCITRTTSRRIPVEAFREQYANYFPIFGMSRENAERYLDAYIVENAVDGFIEDESRHNLSVITWNTPKEETV